MGIRVRIPDTSLGHILMVENLSDEKKTKVRFLLSEYVPVAQLERAPGYEPGLVARSNRVRNTHIPVAQMDNAVYF